MKVYIFKSTESLLVSNASEFGGRKGLSLREFLSLSSLAPVEGKKIPINPKHFLCFIHLVGVVVIEKQKQNKIKFLCVSDRLPSTENPAKQKLSCQAKAQGLFIFVIFSNLSATLFDHLLRFIVLTLREHPASTS